MFLGLALMIGALLWARDLRRRPNPSAKGLRGPWIMGSIGLAVFLFYLWLITHGAFRA